MAEWITAERLESRIDLRGYAPELWSLMKQATVFVSPSLFEGSPNVVLEAMACGVPLVVSDIPEHRELVDESSAQLVSPKSAPELAGAIEDVLGEPGPAAARAHLARERATQYGMPAIARRYDEMYHEVLSGQRAGQSQERWRDRPLDGIH
jgi:glycosyltransferase involved in cell wall biosynthesis